MNFVLAVLKLTAGLILALIMVVVFARLWNKLIEASGIPDFFRKILRAVVCFLKKRIRKAER